jgi:predicted outer membrane lipoprotein
MCGNNPYRVHTIVCCGFTQGCRCAPTAGLKLANAFGVIKPTPHHLFVTRIGLPQLTQGCRCAPTAGLKSANAFGVIIHV